MKIFLSYGHEAHNQPIVDRIERDLIAAGYDVWRDRSAIKAGEDWRRSIVDGLKDSDWTLGFLSRHSVRDPGVCLDELGLALHEKGGAIATVLLDAEVMEAPPALVSHIHWLDMHDWARHQAAGPEAFERWYRPKLKELLDLLASPQAQRFAAEIEELQGRLAPASQSADIVKLIDGFVGREWLQEKLADWQDSARHSRLFWLSGGAGSGKSAFAAWLAHHRRVHVLGINLCLYNDDVRRDAGRVLRTLAFQMATRLPDYRRLLVDRLRREDREEVQRRSPASLFSWLLIEPLAAAIDGGRRENRFAVVIDGLDETVRDGRSELVEILAAHAAKLPGWIALVVTSRPEEPILRQFAGLVPVHIEAESAENLEDARIYVRGWLATQDLPRDKAESLLKRILAASEGNFLYLRMLGQAITEGTLPLEAPEDFPQGLVGLYERWFRRHFPNRGDYERYVPLLEVLAAAEHPVPEPWLRKLFGWSIRDEALIYEGLPSLFEHRPAGVTLFHKSLRDWLLNRRKAGTFVIDRAAGTRLLADGLWNAFLERTSEHDFSALDPFCLAELPLQMMRLRDADLHRLSALRPWAAIQLGLSSVAESCAAAYAWQDALAWWKMVALLAGAIGEEGRPAEAHACVEAGDIHVTLGDSSAALKSFRDGLAIAERLATADPGNAGWQRDLGTSYEKVGNLVLAQGNFSDAIAMHRSALKIRNALVAITPSQVTIHRDVACSHCNIGDALRAQGNSADASENYKSALAIMEKLAATDPTNRQWQGDIAELRANLDCGVRRKSATDSDLKSATCSDPSRPPIPI